MEGTQGIQDSEITATEAGRLIDDSDTNKSESMHRLHLNRRKRLAIKKQVILSEREN
jgi:hypothetical protein